MRDYIGDEPSLPGKPTSVWLDGSPDREFPRLEGDRTADVVVVGGGLVGVATAFMLRRSGHQVILLEGREVLGDVTGHTTAKATVQHGAVYAHLRDHVGELAAVTYAEANFAGLNTILTLADELAIDCGVERVDSYLYAETDDGLADLLREVAACEALGMPVEYVESVPAPLQIRGAVRLPDQAVFDPVAFGFGLLDASDGVEVVLGRAHTVRDRHDGRVEVVTDSGSVAGWSVVMATHYPFWDRGGFFTRLYPYRSYALAARLAEDVPRDAFYSVDSEMGLRRWDGPDGLLAIVSGEHHKAGQGGDERERYRALEQRAREQLPIESVAYHWSTQDNRTPDKLPYVGRSPFSERVFLATGFRAWGMTNSLAAATLLTDLVLHRPNAWASVFDPRRVRPLASASSFLTENFDVARHFVADRMRPTAKPAHDIAAGEGGIVDHGGHIAAIHRADDGSLHALDARCRHLDCIVGWNEAEQTWDCPCHGSRYLRDGSFLHGPASRPLRHARETEWTEGPD